jgi:hypothetical protein
VANDGVYTGDWIPDGAGEVTLTARASFSGGPLQSSINWRLPDYLVSDDVPFDRVDTAGGQDAGITGDDAQNQIPLGFSFEFFGAARNTVTISSNGYLTFGPYGQSYLNDWIPTAAAPTDLIAPYWDDLDPSRGGEVVYLREGSAPSRSLTVEWRGVPYYWYGGAVTIQVTLYEADGRIVFRYLDVVSGLPGRDRGASATVGIEDATGQLGVQYSYNAPGVSNGKAIEFSLPVSSLCADSDGDGICDPADNCPFAPNSGQQDSGGTASEPPDGIGDACQCGDVSDDGQITLTDFGQIRQFFLSGGTTPPTPSFVAEKCDVSGDQKCTLTDFGRVRGAFLGGFNHNPIIVQGCPPAVP